VIKLAGLYLELLYHDIRIVVFYLQVRYHNYQVQRLKDEAVRILTPLI
jgi:hypothetical protein